MSSFASALPPSRLLPRDVLRVGAIGLVARKAHAALSALGIAIGIASMVAVLGISASSQADLLRTIDRLGTNLLTVKPGDAFFGQTPELPTSATARLGLLPGVQKVTVVYQVPDVAAELNPYADQDNGIVVEATDRRLPDTMGATMADGHFLTAAEEQYPPSCWATWPPSAWASRRSRAARRSRSTGSRSSSSGSSAP